MYRLNCQDMIGLFVEDSFTKVLHKHAKSRVEKKLASFCKYKMYIKAHNYFFSILKQNECTFNGIIFEIYCKIL